MLRSWDVAATCNSGGYGSSKIWAEHAAYFHDANVIILPDNDETGRKYADAVAASLRKVDARVRIIDLPGLPPKVDIVDWAAAGETAERRHDLIGNGAAHMSEGVSLDDFNAYMPTHSYIFTPSREMWPAASINARISPVSLFDKSGQPVFDKDASKRLCRPACGSTKTSLVEQMNWAPGQPMLIPDRLISDGGWIERMGVSCFNLYEPPVPQQGNPAEAGPWLGHVSNVFPDDAEHIIKWLAQRCSARKRKSITH